MTHPHVGDLIPGEHILWQGRPDWRALARDVLHVRWIALYFSVFLIRGAYLDRSAGLGPVQAMAAGLPLLILAVAVLSACAALAWAYARSTRYTITSERCLLSFGMALTVTLSLPLRRIAAVSVALHGDGSGDIPVALKPGRRIAFLKLWPHARPWRVTDPQPMLRGVTNAAQVAAVLSHAVAAVSPGRLAPLPARRPRSAAATRPLTAAAELPGAGD